VTCLHIQIGNDFDEYYVEHHAFFRSFAKQIQLQYNSFFLQSGTISTPCDPNFGSKFVDYYTRSAYEQTQLKLGEEIESFEISRRLIAQKSKIPNPTSRPTLTYWEGFFFWPGFLSSIWDHFYPCDPNLGHRNIYKTLAPFWATRFITSSWHQTPSWCASSLLVPVNTVPMLLVSGQ